MFPFGIKTMPNTPTSKPLNATEIARRAAQSDHDGAGIEAGDMSRPYPTGVNVLVPGIEIKVKANAPAITTTLPRMVDPGETPPAMRTTAEAAQGGFTGIAGPADLGRLVRSVRERRKLSQQEFADLAGVGRRFLSELENGKPTLELGKVLKVAGAAGIAVFARER
jgi:HTH-type transcriptional regulator/antitoxin HipB